MSAGTLYGVGVGPGDPELLTLKAVRVLAAAPVIAYPFAAERLESRARRIAAPHIPEGRIELPIPVPMRGDSAAAYDAGSALIAGHLEAGRDVAVLCDGDPLFFGTFAHVHWRLVGRFAIEVIPGVSSVMAAGDVARMPLVARHAAVAVLSGAMPEERLESLVAAADAVAIMKLAGDNLAKARRVLGRLGLTGIAVYVEDATLPSQRVVPLADVAEASAPYFSMILVRPVDRDGEGA